MMRCLLDTHALLWFLESNPHLSEAAKEAISCEENCVFVSIASIWELGIKLNLGKLRLDIEFQQLESELERLNVQVLPVRFHHVEVFSSLQLIHRDPFDRMLICQAITDDLVLISKDKKIFKYPRLNRLW
jgi:PIN domain nuclease of toxin-antitoxin system